MILIDTNVIIDARDRASRFRAWAQNILAHALSTEGLALNAIVLAELCVGHKNPEAMEAELRADGLVIVDLPLPLPRCAPVRTRAIALPVGNQEAVRLLTHRCPTSLSVRTRS